MAPRKVDGLKQDDIDRMLKSRDAKAQAATGLDAAAPSWTEEPQAPKSPYGAEGGGGSEKFERPEPLTLAKLHAVKRAALFG